MPGISHIFAQMKLSENLNLGLNDELQGEMRNL